MKYGLLVLLLAAVAAGLTVCVKAQATPEAMSLEQLEGYTAGECGVCCDPDGSWNDCPGVSGDYQCDEVLVERFGETGFECEDEGADCTWAPEGPDNAQCEGKSNSHCEYGSPGFCSWYKDGGCYSHIWMVGECGIIIWECRCSGGDITTTPNNSRITCSGTDCSFL